MQAGVTEEDYYFSEYTTKEREEGLHLAAMKFVSLEHCRQLLHQQCSELSILHAIDRLAQRPIYMCAVWVPHFTSHSLLVGCSAHASNCVI
jgi:hypothetical protein